jgi:hypothetical protein
MIVVGRGRGRLRAGDELTGAGRGVCGAPKAAVSAFGGVRADEREADREEPARSRPFPSLATVIERSPLRDVTNPES